MPESREGTSQVDEGNQSSSIRPFRVARNAVLALAAATGIAACGGGGPQLPCVPGACGDTGDGETTMGDYLGDDTFSNESGNTPQGCFLDFPVPADIQEHCSVVPFYGPVHSFGTFLYRGGSPAQAVKRDSNGEWQTEFGISSPTYAEVVGEQTFSNKLSIPDRSIGEEQSDWAIFIQAEGQCPVEDWDMRLLTGTDGEDELGGIIVLTDDSETIEVENGKRSILFGRIEPDEELLGQNVRLNVTTRCHPIVMLQGNYNNPSQSHLTFGESGVPLEAEHWSGHLWGGLIISDNTSE